MNNRYRDPIIIFGAVICFIEFMALGMEPAQKYIILVGVMHLMASFVLLITMVLYITMWRMGWVLFLRVIFAVFIVFMMISSLRFGINLLFSA